MLDEIYAKLVEDLTAEQRNTLVKNLRLWISNAVRFPADPTKSRINKANPTFKTLIQPSVHKKALMLAIGYTKAGMYYDVTD
jgi:hypothetical protein